jgi:hypothetical protein
MVELEKREFKEMWDKAWRKEWDGLNLLDLGGAWEEIGATVKNQTVSDAGSAMLKLAPPLLSDLRARVHAGDA